MTPYLIQRGKFRLDESRKGLDKLVAFDYMGSSEFEFGALNQSLKEIRKSLVSYNTKTMHFSDAIKITIFAKDIDAALTAINGIGNRCFTLKGFCDFYDWCNDGSPLVLEKSSRNNFWWDIGNNFMWWISNPNDVKIIEAIKGE